MKNETLIQFFHWYFPVEGNLWQHARNEAAELARLGISFVWLPPAWKSADGTREPGYAVYDLFDLGEFDQKGTVRTRWGTKEEYIDAINELHRHGVKVLADAVFNHRVGADEHEEITIQRVKEESRNEFSDEAYRSQVATRFSFPGRNGEYSNYIWDHQSFTGLQQHDQTFLIHTEHTQGTWGDVLSYQHGNFDYLLGCDVEFRNPYVREELKRWGKWFVETTQADGFRFDALKHVDTRFFPEFIEYVQHETGKKLFCMGETWKDVPKLLIKCIEETNELIQLFDVPLHYNFHKASKAGRDFDLRRLAEDALITFRPKLSITFVDNHDTQPKQSLESFVEPWFKPLAYAFVLLREQGIPCVFYPGLYGASYEDNGEQIEIRPVQGIQEMLIARSCLSYGRQQDYFDHPNVIGWTREGSDAYPYSGIAVVLSNGNEGYKTMQAGKQHAGSIYIDCTGNRPERVKISENGDAMFFANAGSVSVWVNEKFKFNIQEFT